MPGSTISDAPDNNCCAASFLCLRLRSGHTEDYLEVGESEVGAGL